uniref:Uncharacterized protein n=1 Tax=Oxytricha trifallax TaxID=1172189 RepID=G9HRB6_9SPIT|nr:hypothetical protein [Oxytricha trifallax]
MFFKYLNFFNRTVPYSYRIVDLSEELLKHGLENPQIYPQIYPQINQNETHLFRA